MIELIKVVLLGILEGVTEFLPISSTGHLIVGVALLQPNLNEMARETFEIFIQLGAVVAVVFYYASELLGQARRVQSDVQVQRLWLGIVVAFVPAAILGILLRGFIKDVLFNPVTVALSLIVGGVVLIAVEQLPALRARQAAYEAPPDVPTPLPPSTENAPLPSISLRQALLIGLAQTIALIPGMSRSAASIVGGMLVGLPRTTATKFSFYLAIPTLGLATLADLALSLNELSASDLPYFVVGTIVAGIVAWLSIRWLLGYVARHTLVLFGVYRIIAGTVILLLVATSLLPMG